MFDFLIVVKDNALAITTLVGVFTIIGGFIGAHIKNKREKEKYELEKQKIEADKKSLRQQMITNNIAPMRQAWINDARNKISEFIHDSLLLRVELISFLFDMKKSKGKKFKSINHETREYILFSKINQNVRYLDILLPFNLEDESRNELLSEMVRENAFKIISNFDRVFNMLNDGNIIGIETFLNNVLSISDTMTSDAKKLLLQEWRVTKSLKEIE